MRIVLALIALIMGAGNALAQGKGAWFADAKTGCKFWENDPEPGETITWSGKCVNGIVEGPGTLEIFIKGKPNQHFEGMMKGGKANGPAFIRFLDSGDSMNVIMKDNVREGPAVYNFASGDRFEGTYHNDVKSGHGVYTSKAGWRYDGEYRNDKPHGHGTLTKDGKTYTGTWTNGCFEKRELKLGIDTTAAACGYK
jgi:hypothetical protein